MAFFQKSVINKYIQSIDKQVLQTAYTKFRAHFHNAATQKNIRLSKEEQYQGEFLIDLFVNVLGYTKNPTPNFNLTTEFKNVKDSKKADGAIIINDVVKAVIELKGTNTTDLNKIEIQAFGYKNNQPECEYVITSNFEKIRFYIDNAIEYTEFNLFTLTEKEFELLYICLSYESIAKGLPKQIKDESVSQEALITKKLYKDYSDFKHELYHNLVKLNPQYEPLELFKRSQKLLDRFLFIFFAEDRQLLPTNLIFRINKEWQQLKEMRIEVSLYDRYKIYFNDLNTGARVSLPAFSQTASKQKEEFDIYGYNGGLFQKDELLNDIKIDDPLLFLHTEKLSNYDFASEVDVNVLGHIFENSLNDVDEIKAQLEGQVIDKTKTKRKKDGVFYTPKYITKYIVDNTVGKLCAEKKEELQLNENDYATDKKRQKKTTKALSDKLNDYRNWLLQLTICDPACGSGAFLNQALDFLITEHKYIDELQAKLFGDALVLSDVEGSILENNLFGVDINEESVEIAKLSLWLRTAQPNRRLNDLNNNIKCGNSLIDDVTVAGDKAFNWQQEFPQVFPNCKRDENYISVNERVFNKRPNIVGDELGKYKDDSWGLYNEFHEPRVGYKTKKQDGFDVVIGNPPYVRAESILSIKPYLSKKYQVFNGNGDLYSYFYERGLLLLKSKGLFSFITPNKWIQSNYGFELREFLSKYKIIQLLDFGELPIFEDAGTFPMIIVLSNNKKLDNFKFKEIHTLNEAQNLNITTDYIEIVQETLDSKNWILKNKNISNLLSKLENSLPKLGDLINNKFFAGIKTGANKLFIYDKDEITKITNGNKEELELFKPILFGQDFSKYIIMNNNLKYIFFPYKYNNGTNTLIDLTAYPNTYNYFKGFEKQFINRAIIKEGVLKGSHKWYELQQINKFFNYDEPKIIYPDIAKENRFIIDVNGIIPDMTCFFIPSLNSEYLPILNCKIFKFLASNYCPILGSITLGGRIRYKSTYLSKIPFPKISEINKLGLNKFAQIRINNSQELFALTLKFQRSLERKFELIDLPKKLENWYLLSYSDFIKELAKKKVKLSLADEAEWEDYFTTEAKKALKLKNKIDTTDKEIDQMVYKLYDLSAEEIKIVEKTN